MKHRTTEDLRDVLFDTIDRVRDGSLDPKAAKVVADTAGRIIETARLEIEYAETLSVLENRGQDGAPGKVLLTSKTVEGDDE